MKIRMLQGLAGANFSLAPGEIPLPDQFTDKEAKRLIKAGIAEEVKDAEGKEVTLKLTLDNENLRKQLEEFNAVVARLKDAEEKLTLIQQDKDAIQQRAETAEHELSAGKTEIGLLQARIVELEKPSGDDQKNQETGKQADGG